MHLIRLALAAYLVATPALAEENPLFPARNQLAALRTAGMVEAEGCEAEATRGGTPLPACSQWRDTMANYLDVLAERAAWCAPIIRSQPAAAYIPLDCPMEARLDADPVVTRYNRLAPKVGLPTLED